MTQVPRPAPCTYDDAVWRKSSFSGGNTACIEVAPLANGAAVRDSKSHGNGTLMFSESAWRTFNDALRDEKLT